MHSLILIGKEVVIVCAIAGFSGLTLLVETFSHPHVVAGLVAGASSLAVHFLRFWLRARERRKSEAQAWREEVKLLREEIAALRE